MRELVYSEEFVDSRVLNNPESIRFILSRIREIHSADYGWEVGDPTITPNSDGKTVTIKVRLEKYKTNNMGRSR